MRTVWLVLLAVIVLAGCGSDPIQSGTVQGRLYDDPDSWIYWQPIYGEQCHPETRTSYNGKTTTTYTTTVCNSVVISHIPIQQHDPAHWYLKVRDDKDPKHVGKVEVSENTFNAYGVGQHWPDPR